MMHATQVGSIRKMHAVIHKHVHMRRAACAPPLHALSSSHNSTKSEAVQITLEIARCQSWPELEALHSEHHEELWHINVAALHTRLSQVVWPSTGCAVLPPAEEAAVLGRELQLPAGTPVNFEEEYHLQQQQQLYQVRSMEVREQEAFAAFYTRLSYTTGRAMRRNMAAREICTIASSERLVVQIRPSAMFQTTVKQKNIPHPFSPAAVDPLRTKVPERAAARLGMRHAWLLDELREASLPLLHAAARGDAAAIGTAAAAVDLRQMAQLAYSFGKLHFVPEGPWLDTIFSASEMAMHRSIPSKSPWHSQQQHLSHTSCEQAARDENKQGSSGSKQTARDKNNPGSSSSEQAARDENNPGSSSSKQTARDKNNPGSSSSKQAACDKNNPGSSSSSKQAACDKNNPGSSSSEQAARDENKQGSSKQTPRDENKQGSSKQTARDENNPGSSSSKQAACDKNNQGSSKEGLSVGSIPQTSPELAQWQAEVQQLLHRQQAAKQRQVLGQMLTSRHEQREVAEGSSRAEMDGQNGAAVMQSLANLVYALVVLMGVTPHPSWMSVYYEASMPLLRMASGAELVQVMRALQALSPAPSSRSPFLQAPPQHHRASLEQQQHHDDQQPDLQQQQQQQQQPFDNAQQLPHTHHQHPQQRQAEDNHETHHPDYNSQQQQHPSQFHTEQRPPKRRKRSAQQQQQKRPLSLEGVPSEWVLLLLQALQQQSGAATSDKFKVMLSEMATSVEDALPAEDRGVQLH